MPTPLPPDQCLEQALDSLERPLRAPLALRSFAGLDWPHIGRLLDLPATDAEQRAREAQGRLRETLARQGILLPGSTLDRALADMDPAARLRQTLRALPPPVAAWTLRRFAMPLAAAALVAVAILATFALTREPGHGGEPGLAEARSEPPTAVLLAFAADGGWSPWLEHSFQREDVDSAQLAALKEDWYCRTGGPISVGLSFEVPERPDFQLVIHGRAGGTPDSGQPADIVIVPDADGAGAHCTLMVDRDGHGPRPAGDALALAPGRHRFELAFCDGAARARVDGRELAHARIAPESSIVSFRLRTRCRAGAEPPPLRIDGIRIARCESFAAIARDDNWH